MFGVHITLKLCVYNLYAYTYIYIYIILRYIGRRRRARDGLDGAYFTNRLTLRAL